MRSLHAFVLNDRCEMSSAERADFPLLGHPDTWHGCSEDVFERGAQPNAIALQRTMTP
jgi:hypothetical protein